MPARHARIVTILAGGGLDSTALIPLYQERGERVGLLHFDYGQPPAKEERRAVRALARHYAVPAETVKLGIQVAQRKFEFRARNALLIWAALSRDAKTHRVALGLHAGSPYYDGSPRFVADQQHAVDGYFGGEVQIEAPFRAVEKADVWKYAVSKGVPIGKTYSCQRAGGPCGRCLSCRDRRILRAL